MSVIAGCLAHCRALARARVGNERGAAFVEYALLLALIVVVCLLAVTFIGETTGESLSETASQLH